MEDDGCGLGVPGLEQSVSDAPLAYAQRRVPALLHEAIARGKTGNEYMRAGGQGAERVCIVRAVGTFRAAPALVRQCHTHADPTTGGRRGVRACVRAFMRARVCELVRACERACMRLCGLACMRVCA